MRTYGVDETAPATQPPAHHLQHDSAENSPGPAGHPPVRAWPLLLLAAPAAVAIWSGWVGLGELAGFGTVRPLPGIADDFTINTAITLPIGMEAYAAYALRAWLTPGTPPRARAFAKRSAIGALVLGALGQIAYHLLAAAEVTAAPWQITTLVACLPVGVLGMGAALAHLLRDTGDTAQDHPAAPRDHLQPDGSLPRHQSPTLDSDSASQPIAEPEDSPGRARNTSPALRPAQAQRPLSPTATEQTRKPEPAPGQTGLLAGSAAPTTAACSTPSAGVGRKDTHRTPRHHQVPTPPRLTDRERDLLPRAHNLYDAHLADTGKPLSRNGLRRELGIGTDSAGRLLAAVRDAAAQAQDEQAA